jgi:hypothetical protein
MKLMFVASDQRRSARCAAPTTSLPGTMLAGGLCNEVESVMRMVFVGHLRRTDVLLLCWCV